MEQEDATPVVARCGTANGSDKLSSHWLFFQETELRRQTGRRAHRTGSPQWRELSLQDLTFEVGLAGRHTSTTENVCHHSWTGRRSAW